MSKHGFLLTAPQARVLTTVGRVLTDDIFIESYGNPGKTGPVYVRVGDAALVVLVDGDSVPVDSERIAA